MTLLAGSPRAGCSRLAGWCHACQPRQLALVRQHRSDLAACVVRSQHPPPQSQWAASIRGSPGISSTCAMRTAASASTESATTAAAGSALVSDRKQHNQRQADSFDAAVEHFAEEQPPEVLERLDRIVAAVPGLGSGSRVLDVGSGTGALIPHLQAAGLTDILAVDLSDGMLAALRRRFQEPSSLGNDPAVRTWVGDVVDLPAYQGPFDAAFLNAMFGNVADQRATLLAAAMQLRPSAHVVISHPLGRAWQQDLHESSPETVPHPLPDQYALVALISDLPLRLVQYIDLPDLYLAVLQVPPGYLLQAGPRRLAGAVTTGFGRGSTQMGVPTANLPPEPLVDILKDLPSGVYFGWARLRRTPENEHRPDADFETHKMVMNVGLRPTLADGAGLTVEAHVLHRYSANFYGEPLRVIATGFLRPEMKFGGLDALIARIRTDIGVAAAQLETPEHTAFRNDPFLLV